jgi:AcrR family transcriptional regulator
MSMQRDAEATKKRLVEAATAEFAQYGIGGARVDRIAEVAKANKAQIYHYFGSKDDLFDAVFNEAVVDTFAQIHIEADDLPESAGRLFDLYEERPEMAKLATWHRLERGDSWPPIDAIVSGSKAVIHDIESAQRRGVLADAMAPVDVLALLMAVAQMWTTFAPEFQVFLADHTRAGRRKIVTEAVAAAVGKSPARIGAAASD